MTAHIKKMRIHQRKHHYQVFFHVEKTQKSVQMLKQNGITKNNKILKIHKDCSISVKLKTYHPSHQNAFPRLKFIRRNYLRNKIICLRKHGGEKTDF